MGKPEYLLLLKRGSIHWNNWRATQPAPPPAKEQRLKHPVTSKTVDEALSEMSRGPQQLDLTDLTLDGIFLSMVNCNNVNLTMTTLRGAYLADGDFSSANMTKVDLGQAELRDAIFVKANLTEANLSGAKIVPGANFNAANLTSANCQGIDLQDADLRETNLTLANLSDVNLTRADLRGAKLWGATLDGAKLAESRLDDANLTHVSWDIRRMSGRYRGIRGLDSCYGNALFKRAAADQDYLDTLKHSVRFSLWGSLLFWIWGLLDYGRSLWRVTLIAAAIGASYGAIYSHWPYLIDYTQSVSSKFTPYYFSIVTFTTLGFGDVKPASDTGEILVCSEVILGYATLGVLLSVLVEKLARRS